MSDYARIGFHRPPPPESSDGSEDDADREGRFRTSTDIRQLDKELLEEEEEAEKLLGRSSSQGKTSRNVFGRKDGSSSNNVKLSGRERRKYKREARRSHGQQQKEEASQLMYDMEEGHKDSSDSANSSDIDRLRLKELPETAVSGKSRMWKITGLHIIVIVAFFALLFGAYAASRNHRPQSHVKTMSNGTSEFAPTTIYISLDGFRADFLHRNITPSLNAFVRAGVSPEYMLPSFPSVTFPNHYTLVTGLYPESHGVVGNTFWDPDLKEDFYYTDPTKSMQSKWWQAEPIWVTAEEQGVRTAIHMWPGSEAHIGPIEPTFVDKYKGHEVLSNKVDRILQLLDLPGPLDTAASTESPRPQLIAAYVPDVDRDGHLYGPNSTEIRTTISRVDTMLGQLFHGLEQRNLTDLVNIVIVSDHGMATTSTSRLIQLDDIIDMSTIHRTDGWPLYGLRPTNDSDIQPLYQKLKKKASVMQGFDVHLRDSDMPTRYHFTQNPRIAPLWIIPHTGWNIVVKSEFDIEEAKKTGQIYHPRGVHGYDHEHPLMRAIFVARGPAFPHVGGSKVDVFQNIEVYNLICDSVGVKPRENNGTMRLPLKTIGTHDSQPPSEIPEDLGGDTPSEVEGSDHAVSVVNVTLTDDKTVLMLQSTAVVPESTTDVEITPTYKSTSTATATVTATAKTTPSRPVIQDDPTEDNPTKNNPTQNNQSKPKNPKNKWLQWLKTKLDGVKDWATDVYTDISDKVSNKNNGDNKNPSPSPNPVIESKPKKKMNISFP